MVANRAYYILQNSYFTHTHIYRSTSTRDLTGNDSATASYDFENPINLAEDEGEGDCEVPSKLARLLLQEERVIQPHEEPVGTVNLGTEVDKKEVKIGANLESSVKQRLIQMLFDYVKIFAWVGYRYCGSPIAYQGRLSFSETEGPPNAPRDV